MCAASEVGGEENIASSTLSPVHFESGVLDPNHVLTAASSTTLNPVRVVLPNPVEMPSQSNHSLPTLVVVVVISF